MQVKKDEDDSKDGSQPVPKNIDCGEQVMGLSFHPTNHIAAAGLISGEVKIYRYFDEEKQETILKDHENSCRVVVYANSGDLLFTGSKDRSICCYGNDGNLKWKQKDSHSHAINSLYNFDHDENLLASGDEEGGLRLWDIRNSNGKPVSESKDHKDFISNMEYHEDKQKLLTAGGDGCLGVYDLRRGKLKLEKLSDEQEDELLSLSIVKGGRKVVVGTQDGILNLFSWGQWGDISDRFPGHPQSIDAMLKIDEDTICTGSSDGIIRFVSILPNKLLGIAGDHNEFPIERMDFTHDRCLIGTSSHDSVIRFFDVSYLNEDDEEDEDEIGGNSNDDDGGDDSSDEDAGKGKGKGKIKEVRPRKKMKAASGKAQVQDFFSDL